MANENANNLNNDDKEMSISQVRYQLLDQLLDASLNSKSEGAEAGAEAGKLEKPAKMNINDVLNDVLDKTHGPRNTRQAHENLPEKAAGKGAEKGAGAASDKGTDAPGAGMQDAWERTAGELDAEHDDDANEGIDEGADTEASEGTENREKRLIRLLDDADIALISKDGAASQAAEKIAAAYALIPKYSEMSAAERFAQAQKPLFLEPCVTNQMPRRERNDFRLLEGIAELRYAAAQAESELLGREQRQNQQQNGHNERGTGNPQNGQNTQNGQNGQNGQDERQNRRGANNNREETRKTQEPAQKQQVTEPQRVKGSTRLEAKRQRRRDVRSDSRSRRGHISESEFLARRESVDRKMVVRTHGERIQIGVLEDDILVEHYVAKAEENSLIGNVYYGRVQNVLPSMEAAFVDIGRGRNAVLYSGEVDWSEYTGSVASRKIEQVLKSGDHVLVQVTKDPVGQKGARLTSQVSLPGRYLVYVPGGAMNGISRKLPDNERTRLKKILKKILPDGAGVIVRTAAEGATEEQLTRDVNHLTRQWEKIQRQSGQGGGPKTLHAEADMLIKIIRDVFNEDFQELIIDDPLTYKRVAEYLEDLAPDLLERVKLFEGSRDIFQEHRITSQIQKALDRKVYLPSGGSLVIDRTEAMTVIDVNTGKFIGSGGNLEQTVTKNNIEAAEEIVRQLRLRDIGGIVVIDFIDMVLESNRDLVQRRLIECLGRDRTKHQVAEVTSLGLVQMTRKKLGLGLLETFSQPCDICAGRGVIVDQYTLNTHSHSTNGNGDKPGTHKLTDGAKNMLAQVAAKTIAPAQDNAPAKAQGAGQKPALERKKPLQKRGKRRATKQGGASDSGATQSGAIQHGAIENKAAGKDAAQNNAAQHNAGSRGSASRAADAKSVAKSVHTAGQKGGRLDANLKVDDAAKTPAAETTAAQTEATRSVTGATTAQTEAAEAPRSRARVSRRVSKPISKA